MPLAVIFIARSVPWASKQYNARRGSRQGETCARTGAHI
jgi:hypothetical protein